MKRFGILVAASLLCGCATASAATLSWGWDNPAQLEGVQFNVYREGELISTVADPERSVAYTRIGGESLEVEASTVSACSPRSEPLTIPGRPINLKTRAN